MNHMTRKMTPNDLKKPNFLATLKYCSVSRIIGQKGKQIQEIIDRSNIAKVRFPSDHETRSILNMSKSEITKNAIIILIGTKQANENACTMMDYLVGSLNEIQAMHKQHRRLDSVSRFSSQHQWIFVPWITFPLVVIFILALAFLFRSSNC